MIGMAGSAPYTMCSSPRRRDSRDLREFYIGVLGMTEMAKPAGLACRGGVCSTSGTAELHLGIEAGSRPTSGQLAKPIQACWLPSMRWCPGSLPPVTG